MNNDQLMRLRVWLEEKVRQKYDSVGEDSADNSVLDMMQVSQESGEAHTARKLLENLPEPESDTVLNYQAIERIIDEDLIDPEIIDVRSDIEYEIRRISNDLREQAIDEVSERIVCKEKEEDEFVVLTDPISKSHYRYSHTLDREMNVMKRMFAKDIVEGRV